MLQRDVAMLESPSPRVLAALREWLHGPSRASNRLSKLDGRDRDMFSVGSDLVAVKPPADADLMSRLLRNHWPFPTEVCRYRTLTQFLFSPIDSHSACRRMSGTSSDTSRTAGCRG